MYKKILLLSILCTSLIQSKQRTEVDAALLVTRLTAYVSEEMHMLDIAISDDDITYAAQAAVREYEALLMYKAKHQEPDESHNLDDKVILSNVTAIMMNALLMIINNKDKEKLAAGGCNIIQGLSNIIKETTKHISLEEE